MWGPSKRKLLVRLGSLDLGEKVLLFFARSCTSTSLNDLNTRHSYRKDFLVGVGYQKFLSKLYTIVFVAKITFIIIIIGLSGEIKSEPLMP